jgi:hypothetical protein
MRVAMGWLVAAGGLFVTSLIALILADWDRSRSESLIISPVSFRLDLNFVTWLRDSSSAVVMIVHPLDFCHF